MKKLLLFSALAACGISAMAADYTPTTLENFFGQKISPNGRYVTSNIYGTFSVFDIESNRMIWTSDADVDGEYYSGNGNSISNKGAVVGSFSGADLFAVIRDGKMYVPSWAEEIKGGFSGITPDGTLICGSVYKNGYLARPNIFTVDAMGNISAPIDLPFPEKDMLGNEPQHINANWISNDGTVIAGCLLDDSGRFCTPIVYTKDADGKWSYTLPAEKLFNPNGIVLPPAPGNYPESPLPTDYMSEEAVAAYNAQMEAYYNSGYDESLFPNPADYMTPEQIEAYNAAVEAFNKEAEEYNKSIEEYFTAVDEISATSVSFQYNTIALDASGKYLTAAAEIPGETFWDPDVLVPYLFNLEDGTFEALNTTQSLAGTAILDNGVILAATPMSFGGLPQSAYVYDPTKKEFLSYADYLAANNNPGPAAWINETLVGTTEIGYDDDWNPIYGEVAVTGYPFSTPDGTVMGGGCMPYVLDAMQDIFYYTYIFNDVKTGISNVAVEAADITVKALKGGVLLVEGEVAAVSVYDLSGRQVYAADAVDGTAINTGLPTGLYVVKATAANGDAVTSKVIF